MSRLTKEPERPQCKFEVAYFIAREKLAFAKMQPLCELQERHGVKLGLGYKNDHACSTFVEFIACDLQQNQLAQINSRSKFFSLQADASTNSGKVQNELFLILYFDPYCADARCMFEINSLLLDSLAVAQHMAFLTSLKMQSSTWVLQTGKLK